MKTQMLLLKNDIINGFSYSFTRALYHRFKELFLKNGLCEYEDFGDFYIPRRITFLAENLFVFISQQIPSLSEESLDTILDPDGRMFVCTKEEWPEMQEEFLIRNQKIQRIIVDINDFLKTFEIE